LSQAESHLEDGNKIGPALHALGDAACAHGISQVDDTSAHCLLAAVACAADDELWSDFDLDEGKLVKFREQRPLHSDIVDRKRDGAIPK
jgi:hypothetical protein